MRTLVPFLALALGAPFVASGCLSSSGGTTAKDSGTPPASEDAALSFDGASEDAATPEAGPVDSGPAVIADSAVDSAIPSANLVTGLGSGVVAHSAHFTLVTKTGIEPGGAGVYGSASFKMISGVAPPDTK